MKVELYNDQLEKLDADIYKNKIGSWTEYVIESRGGTLGSENQRNPDYLDALEKLLSLLIGEGCQLQDVLLASKQTINRSPLERRVTLSGRPFPIDLTSEDASSLKDQITRSAAGLLRKPGAKGPGNFTRRLQLIVSNDGHGVFAAKGLEDWTPVTQEPEFYQRRGSGPPPSAFRGSVNRTVGEGFTYALLLHGSETAAIKIGFTSNVERRIDTLNREIRPKLTNCYWELLKSWQFGSEKEAYELEQDLLWLFREKLIFGEREIISISESQFLQSVSDFFASRL